jgi:anti-sigma regulatory factor (Ser/Thr protein kinase)
VRFDPDTRSIAAAREFVVDSAGLEKSQSDVLAVLIGELANNAVLHARTPYNVDVDHSGRSVRVEVRDWSSDLPELQRYRPESLGGRGLQVVAALTDRWGVTPTGDGKIVWFEYRPALSS